MDHVNLQLVAVEVVVQALEQFLGSFVEEKGPVYQVDPKQSSGLLLQQRILLVKTCVQDNRVGLA